jgi:hypothetical protein
MADGEVRRCVAAAMKKSGLSRDQVADRMTQKLGRPVTVVMLADYTAERKTAARFPGAWIAVFCDVVGDDSLQRLVLSPRLRKLLELAERDLAALDDEIKREQLRDELLDPAGEIGKVRDNDA